jgi:hypothetical protein
MDIGGEIGAFLASMMALLFLSADVKIKMLKVCERMESQPGRPDSELV